MKKNLYILTMVVMIITACQQKPKTVPVDTEAEKAAIQKVFDEHFAALDSFDLDKLLSLQTEDIIEMPPNMPRIVGKEAYAFNNVYKHYHLTEHFDTTLLSC